MDHGSEVYQGVVEEEETDRVIPDQLCATAVWFRSDAGCGNATETYRPNWNLSFQTFETAFFPIIRKQS